jgi:hypothetical protein
VKVKIGEIYFKIKVMSEELAEKLVNKIQYIIEEREYESAVETIRIIETVIKAYS